MKKREQGSLNKLRAELVVPALNLFAEQVHGPSPTYLQDSPDEVITDFLTDLRHYCDLRGLDYSKLSQWAYAHYVVERRGGE